MWLLKSISVYWTMCFSQLLELPESFPSLYLRCIKSGAGCGWAGQQPVRGGEPCQGGFCSDGPWPSCTAAQAPDESHLPPWPLLLHPCGQGKPVLSYVLLWFAFVRRHLILGKYYYHQYLEEQHCLFTFVVYWLPCLVLATLSSQMLLPVTSSCIMKVKFIPWVSQCGKGD